MSRLSQSLFLATICILLATAPIQAMTITISSDSQVTIIDDSVLGEQDEEKEIEEEDEREDEDERENKDEREEKSSNKESRPARVQEKRLPKSSGNERKIKLESKSDGIRIKSKTKQNANELDEETKRLELRMPAGRVTNQRKDKPETTEFEDEIEIERDSRSDEEINIRNEDGARRKRLLIESRAVQARFPNKPITIDPETNEVILELKNGETRVLTTLPDQAVERFKTSGELSENDELNFDSLEVEVTDDNQVKYTAKVIEQRRFLGLINRQLEKKVVLDDSTGEVSTEESGETSFLDRVINRFSF